MSVTPIIGVLLFLIVLAAAWLPSVHAGNSPPVIQEGRTADAQSAVGLVNGVNIVPYNHPLGDIPTGLALALGDNAHVVKVIWVWLSGTQSWRVWARDLPQPLNTLRVLYPGIPLILIVEGIERYTPWTPGTFVPPFEPKFGPGVGVMAARGDTNGTTITEFFDDGSGFFQVAVSVIVTGQANILVEIIDRSGDVVDIGGVSLDCGPDRQCLASTAEDVNYVLEGSPYSVVLRATFGSIDRWQISIRRNAADFDNLILLAE